MARFLIDNSDWVNIGQDAQVFHRLGPDVFLSYSATKPTEILQDEVCFYRLKENESISIGTDAAETVWARSHSDAYIDVTVGVSILD